MGEAEHRLRALRHRIALLRDLLLELDRRHGRLADEKQPVHLGGDHWALPLPAVVDELRGELIAMQARVYAETDQLLRCAVGAER